jgi:hypothetical protein
VKAVLGAYGWLTTPADVAWGFARVRALSGRRSERQLGYRRAKYLRRIQITNRFDGIGPRKGGFWQDRGYEWYAGISIAVGAGSAHFRDAVTKGKCAAKIA